MPWEALKNLAFPTEAGEGGGGGELPKDAQDPEQPGEYYVFFPAAFTGRGDGGTHQKMHLDRPCDCHAVRGLVLHHHAGQSSWCALWVEAGHKMHSAQVQEGSGLNAGEMTRPWGRAASKSGHFLMLLQASDPHQLSPQLRWQGTAVWDLETPNLLNRSTLPLVKTLIRVISRLIF